MANILIAGANGLIGKELSSYLHTQGHTIHWLVRKPSAQISYPQFIWDPSNQKIDLNAFKSVDVLINLTGSPISSGRWTAKRKSDILQSRLNSIQVLSDALNLAQVRPRQIIQATAIGFYGDRPNAQVTEKDPAGINGFLCEVTKQWEDKARIFENQTQILTTVRTGLYLSSNGGVWPKLIMTLPFKFISYFGNGNQIYSWIHDSDYIRALAHLIDHKISGPVNLTAPHPVSHKDLVKAIQKIYPCLLIPGPPAIILRILMGEMSSLVLDSCDAHPKVLLDSGFQFKHAYIDSAVQTLLKKSDKA
ncbi:MAG: TIGR01777 family protein [Saprospiraceae bacterium]|nr:TIGR01777 family protein [Saprospiraceae bacterium]